jgi:hypothetical protein
VACGLASVARGAARCSALSAPPPAPARVVCQAEDANRVRPLHLAAGMGRAETVGLLLELGAAPGAPDR